MEDALATLHSVCPDDASGLLSSTFTPSEPKLTNSVRGERGILALWSSLLIATVTETLKDYKQGILAEWGVSLYSVLALGLIKMLLGNFCVWTGSWAFTISQEQATSVLDYNWKEDIFLVSDPMSNTTSRLERRAWENGIMTVSGWSFHCKKSYSGQLLEASFGKEYLEAIRFSVGKTFWKHNKSNSAAYGGRNTGLLLLLTLQIWSQGLLAAIFTSWIHTFDVCKNCLDEFTNVQKISHFLVWSRLCSF